MHQLHFYRNYLINKITKLTFKGNIKKNFPLQLSAAAMKLAISVLLALALVALFSSEVVDAWGAPHWGKTDYLWWARGYGRGAFIPQGYAILNR